MSEEPKETSETSSQAEGTPQTSWQDVGQQFQALGESLAQVFRTAWENEENQRRLQGVRTGLQSMVQDVGKAIDDSAKSPQAQKLREDAEKTVDKMRNAGEQTIQEVRPQLIDALQQLNKELQKMVDRMDKKSVPPAGTDDTPDMQI